MVELTAQTLQRVEALFSERERADVVNKLEEDCGSDLPLWNPPTPKGLERIRYAVLKLSEGDLDKLDYWIKEANTDWRDVLVAADFADDVKIHRKWMPDAKR